MEITSRFHIVVREQSQVGEARRCAVELAQSLSFADKEVVGNISIVATEMATNLIKHAVEGEIIGQLLGQDHACVGLEILAIDRGPGINNVGASFKDGYSTVKGSAGIGLGAIKRLANEFELHSTYELGTGMFARFCPPNGGRSERNPYRGSSLVIPKQGQQVSGDGVAVAFYGNVAKVLVVDGLGHGSMAAEASRQAIKAFDAHSRKSPAAILEQIHIALKSTRGAAAAITQLDLESRRATYSGVGNISAALCGSGKRQNLVSHNGTLGRELHRVSEFQYPLQPNSVLVMHSDGLSTHWDLERYPGLQSRDPLLIAGILYRDCKKEHDDISIAVLKVDQNAA